MTTSPAASGTPWRTRSLASQVSAMRGVRRARSPPSRSRPPRRRPRRPPGAGEIHVAPSPPAPPAPRTQYSEQPLSAMSWARAHDREVPVTRIRNLDGRVQRRHRVHPPAPPCTRPHRLGRSLPQAERELRLDHRHVGGAGRQLRAAPVELALPEPSGQRAVHADVLLAGFAGGRDLPADRPGACDAGERLLRGVAPLLRYRGGMSPAARRSGDGRTRPSRWPAAARVALRVGHGSNLASGGGARQAPPGRAPGTAWWLLTTVQAQCWRIEALTARSDSSIVRTLRAGLWATGSVVIASQTRGFVQRNPRNRIMSASVEWSSAWCSIARAARCASVVRLPAIPPPRGGRTGCRHDGLQGG